MLLWMRKLKLCKVSKSPKSHSRAQILPQISLTRKVCSYETKLYSPSGFSCSYGGQHSLVGFSARLWGSYRSKSFLGSTGSIVSPLGITHAKWFAITETVQPAYLPGRTRACSSWSQMHPEREVLSHPLQYPQGYRAVAWMFQQWLKFTFKNNMRIIYWLSLQFDYT